MSRKQQTDPELPIHYLNTEDENVAGSLMNGRIQYRYIDLDSGDQLQLFVNRDSGLVVLDLVAKNERGGNELLRQTLDLDSLLRHTRTRKARKLAAS